MVEPLPEADPILSVKVTIRHTRPPIWRRLAMPGVATLRHLHFAIHDALGWGWERLYLFEVAGLLIADTSRVTEMADDDQNITLGELRHFGHTRFTYTRADDDDPWRIAVVIEPAPAKVAYYLHPVCIGGRRNCPPTACGGIRGYEQLLAALADPGSPRYHDWIARIGKKFDPDHFSVEDASRRLEARFRPPPFIISQASQDSIP